MTGDLLTATKARLEPPAARAASCPAEQLLQVVQDMLADLVESVPAAMSATVVVVRGQRLRPWATSGPAGADLDQAQAALGHGPAFTAAAGGGQLVVAWDVRADPRWDLPDLAASPVRSVVAVALPGSARGEAVLVVHGARPDLAAPPVVEQIGSLLPDLVAVVAVVRARLEVADLQVALTTNRVIGAAIGVIMNSHRLTYEAAADLLRSLSNHTNTPMGDLAEGILFTGEVPAPPTSPTRRRPMPRL